MGQPLPEEFELEEILVVTSGCTDGTERVVKAWKGLEPRIALFSEAERRGKTSAVNRILECYRGDILVILNADARLEPCALAELLVPFQGSGDVEIVCGFPIPEPPEGAPLRFLEEFLWGIHNRTLQTLSSLGLENHCCDELMAMRRGFVAALPASLINDGAYLGALASLRGRSVRFCPKARVHIETPRDVHGFLKQRRRIVRGHRQIKALLDHPPNTLEGMIRRRPKVAIGILAAELLNRPWVWPFVLAFLALPLEIWANILAFFDGLGRQGYAPAWEVVE